MKLSVVKGWCYFLRLFCCTKLNSFLYLCPIKAEKLNIMWPILILTFSCSQKAGPATKKLNVQISSNHPKNRRAKSIGVLLVFGVWGFHIAGTVVIFCCVCAVLRLELDSNRQDICSSYPSGVLHKVDSLSSSHGPSGCMAATVPSPNTIRKRGLVYPTVRGLGLEADNVWMGLRLLSG